MYHHVCLFCGGDPSEPGHQWVCDGRQGRTEAVVAQLPALRSGLTVDTFDTSADAAAHVEDTRDTQRERVFDVIAGAGPSGRTDDEVQAVLGIDGSSERPRRWELWKLDRIAVQRGDDGRAVTRETRTHRRAVVWVDARLVRGH